MKKHCQFFLLIVLFACSDNSEEVKSSQKQILSFQIDSVNGTISGIDKTISITVSDSNPITSLIPVIKISEKATITPVAGVAVDFTNPVKYTVTAEDGTTQEYTVTVTMKSSGKSILSFKFTGALNEEFTAKIDESTKSITATIPYGNGGYAEPKITISDKATIFPLATTQIDVSAPVKYTVTAEDGTKQEYTVIINYPKTFVMDTPTATLIELGKRFIFRGQFGRRVAPQQIDFTNTSTGVVYTRYTTIGSTPYELYVTLFDVPAGDYKVTIYIGTTTQTYNETFTVEYQSPIIESLSRTSVAIGQEFTIRGTNFMNTGNKVSLGGTQIEVRGEQGNGIRVLVPASMPLGEHTVSVTSNNKTVTHSTKIKITDDPVITWTNLTSYAQLEVMTIRGLNLQGSIKNINFLPVGGGVTQVRSVTSSDTEGTQVTFKISDDFPVGKYILVIEIDGDFSEEYAEPITIISN